MRSDGQMAAKIRERLEREEAEQMQIARSKLDRVDGDKPTLEDIKSRINDRRSG